MKLIQTQEYLLLIDEEAAVKEGKTFITKDNIIHSNYGYNYGDRVVVAYYPLTKEAKELDLPLLPNPFEEVDVEELSEKANGYAYYGKPLGEKYLAFKEGFIEGYKAAQSKQFSLEDMIAFGKKCFYKGFDKSENDDASCFTAWREESNELVQSLSTQQLPKEFIPEYKKAHRKNSDGEDIGFPVHDSDELKTITNSDGKQELVGIYKY